MDLKRQAYEFIAANRAGSLATVGPSGKPHVATVYVIVEKDLSLYFMTRIEARKFKHLSAHDTVAMNFSDLDRVVTVQLTGRAERIAELEKEQDIMERLLAMRYKEQSWPLPPMQLFQSGATNEIAVIRIKPTEMVYANFETLKTGHYRPFFSKSDLAGIAPVPWLEPDIIWVIFRIRQIEVKLGGIF